MDPQVTVVINKGNLETTNDVDCFAFYGQDGEDFLFALNADPEGDGSTTDYDLTVYDPNDTVIASANWSGVGGNEFIDNITLSGSGIYAYCVGHAAGDSGVEATYLAGLMRNESNYWLTFENNPAWLNPRPGGYALIGDELVFELSFTNTSPLPIPKNIRVQGRFDDACLSLLEAPGAVYSTTNVARWEFIELPAGETFTATFMTRAEAPCNDNMHQGVSMDYFVLGVGKDASYQVRPGLFLPMVNK